MSDDRFDERLRQAAQDYHRPPATPREELWHRIAAARAARKRRVIVVRATLRWGVGIAALLALGVAIGRWSAPGSESPRQARDLLATTRLMLDSPAGKDARLKGLLEDLELVLAQIAQLPASGDREDVQSINQGLDQRSVLLRLRTANPAGPGPVRTQGVL